MSILQDIARLPEDSRYVAFETLIREKARKLRIPTAANFELTPYCTLDCRMCYAKMTPEQVKKTGKRIIGKNEWKRITKEAAELGVYSVSITGGEPLLHPEFKDIYTDIYKNGMQTILMTNCTLIDNEMLDFLSDMPPMYISTTLYGFSSETYERLCGDGSAFKRVISAIQRLYDRGISLSIKATATKYNRDDIADIKRFIEGFGLKLGLVSNITATRQGEEKNLQEVALSLSELDDLERALGKESKIDYFIRTKAAKDKRIGQAPKGFPCSVGKNYFAISWDGRMLPCVAFDPINLYPLQDGLKACWEAMVAWSDGVMPLQECYECEYRELCNICYASNYLDCGEFGKVSDRLCRKKEFERQTK